MFSCLKICVKQSLNNHEYFIQIRNYARWSHRNPVKILPSEEERNVAKNAPKINSVDKNDYRKDKPTNILLKGTPKEKGKKTMGNKASTKNVPKHVTYDMLQTVIDANGEFIYTKLADKDSRIISLLTTLQSNNSKEKKSILLEGKRLIKEALQSKCQLEYLLFSRKDDVEDLKLFLPKSGAKLYKIPYREIQQWSDLTTSPGIMGIFKKPDVENFTPGEHSLPITIVCDNIREPGNLGSILRTCAGVGCENIILTKGCVNIWDSKVIRGSCGAHFHLNILSKIEWPQMGEHVKANKIFMADSNVLSSTEENVEETKLRIQYIPLIPYYGIQIDKTESLVVVVGGETEGLSEDAYKFAYDNQGVRLNVPLNPGIDSLNSGVALGVILFELKKQMLLNSIQEENMIPTFG